MLRALRKPNNNKLFFKKLLLEMYEIGIGSLGIVFIISIFIGAILTIQVAVQGSNPLFPSYLISYGVRESMILEFSSTIIALILSGKIGSQIASEIGTMRVTEQIDALEIMGVNSANYLIAPKLIAACITLPILTILSMFLGIWGGYLSNLVINVVTPQEFNAGLQMEFEIYKVYYSLFKMLVFAIIITTVSGYHGYNVTGGSLNVGKASTHAVVHSSIIIIFFNLLLTQLLL